MDNQENKSTGVLDGLDFKRPVKRRDFMRYTGVAIAATSIISLEACDKDDDVDSDGVNFGTGDTAILNYAYALEQLEAAFYVQVIATPFTGMTNDEKARLTEIRDHEIAHREFFKTALGDKAIQGLEVDFSTIDFTSRASVLGTAKAFEDLGVSAYNGAGFYLADGTNLLLAGKIVSVEARHAAYIRDLISNGSFADNTTVDAKGLDTSRKPRAVLEIAGKYVKTKLNAGSLPA